MEQQERHQNFLYAMERNMPLNIQTETIATSVSNPFVGYVAPWVCPSDGNGQPSTGPFSRGSYHACFGDIGFNDYMNETVYPTSNNLNTHGAFTIGYALTRTCARVSEGLSNTIFFGEAVISQYGGTTNAPVRGGLVISIGGNAPTENRNTCMALKAGNTLSGTAVDVSGVTATGSGRRAFSGFPAFSLFATLNPPNYPSCSRNAESHKAVVTASSMHSGGVNVVLGDGGVRFISETINANNNPVINIVPAYSNGPSAWGIWGAYGTIAGGESVSL
jgi:hypothetical protein